MTVAPTAPISRPEIVRCRKREHEEVGGASMAMQLRNKATLGELIEAVTDEVLRVTRGSENTNILVSHIVRDLISTRRVRLKRRRLLKIA